MLLVKWVNNEKYQISFLQFIKTCGNQTFKILLILSHLKFYHKCNRINDFEKEVEN